jgi:hypothetical protein
MKKQVILSKYISLLEKMGENINKADIYIC